MKKCVKCKKQKFAYRNYEGKVVPICNECYEKYIDKKDRYEALMKKLTKKNYIQILGLGKETFPYTLFGLDVNLKDIIEFIRKKIGNDYILIETMDSKFKFNDFEDDIIVERNMTFQNKENEKQITINLRIGKYNFDNDEILFFTDKQLGLTKSDLSEYSSIYYDENGIHELQADNESNYNKKKSLYPDNLDDKAYFEEKDLKNLLGYIPKNY